MRSIYNRKRFFTAVPLRWKPLKKEKTEQHFVTRIRNLRVLGDESSFGDEFGEELHEVSCLRKETPVSVLPLAPAPIRSIGEGKELLHAFAKKVK